MQTQKFSRVRAALLAGSLAFAPVAAGIAVAPAAAAVSVQATVDPTPAGDGTVINNPGFQDIMPINAPLQVEPIRVANPWPGRIISGLIGLGLGWLLGHLLRRRPTVTEETTIVRDY